MTKGQRWLLAKIGEKGTILGNDMKEATRNALVGLGLIEECERMYFGPREWRYRLTKHGRETLAKQGELGLTRYERDPV